MWYDIDMPNETPQPKRESITQAELARMKERWLVLNADCDAKFFELLNNPAKCLSPEEFNALKISQKELTEIENRVLDSAKC